MHRTKDQVLPLLLGQDDVETALKVSENSTELAEELRPLLGRLLEAEGINLIRREFFLLERLIVDELRALPRPDEAPSHNDEVGPLVRDSAVAASSGVASLPPQATNDAVVAEPTLARRPPTSFRNLFSRTGREAMKAQWAYEECQKHRQQMILSFRRNAAQEILFKFPDARLLLNSLDRRFMVLLKNQGRLLVGKFADDYYPTLEYVPCDGSPQDKQASAAQYRKDVSRCLGNIAPAREKTFREIGEWRGRVVSDCFRRKGYAVTGEAALEYLVGGALFLNGDCIAKASVVDPKPSGYFGSRILEKVVQSGDRNAGPHFLTFVTFECNPLGQGEKFGYEIIFDRSLLHFNPRSREDFASSVIGLRDFLYDIESFFRPDSSVEEEPKPWWGEYLETDAVEENGSIESPYPF